MGNVVIEIAFLADHPAAVPPLAAWFRAQWPDYYARRSQADVEQDMRAEANRDGLPVRLVALVDGELAGTVVLRERALATLPEACPGLGGLFVHEAYRGRGAGTALVRAGMNLARQQGHAVVYATTAAARGILERLGWEAVRVLTHAGEQLALYRATLMALEFKRFQRGCYQKTAG